MTIAILLLCFSASGLGRVASRNLGTPHQTRSLSPKPFSVSECYCYLINRLNSEYSDKKGKSDDPKVAGCQKDTQYIYDSTSALSVSILLQVYFLASSAALLLRC